MQLNNISLMHCSGYIWTAFQLIPRPSLAFNLFRLMAMLAIHEFFLPNTEGPTELTFTRAQRVHPAVVNMRTSRSMRLPRYNAPLPIGR